MFLMPKVSTPRRTTSPSSGDLKQYLSPPPLSSSSSLRPIGKERRRRDNWSFQSFLRTFFGEFRRTMFSRRFRPPTSSQRPPSHVLPIFFPTDTVPKFPPSDVLPRTSCRPFKCHFLLASFRYFCLWTSFRDFLLPITFRGPPDVFVKKVRTKLTSLRAFRLPR